MAESARLFYPTQLNVNAMEMTADQSERLLRAEKLERRMGGWKHETRFAHT